MLPFLLWALREFGRMAAQNRLSATPGSRVQTAVEAISVFRAHDPRFCIKDVRAVGTYRNLVGPWEFEGDWIAPCDVVIVRIPRSCFDQATDACAHFASEPVGPATT